MPHLSSMFSRMIVGWQVSTSMRTDLAFDALNVGLWARRRACQDVAGLIHHSDAVCSIELGRTPSASINMMQWLLLAPKALRMLMRWRRRSTRCYRPSAFAIGWCSRVGVGYRKRVVAGKRVAGR